MSSLTDAVWLNGEVRSRAETCLPVDERAFRYGDAVFATLLCVPGRLLAVERHMRRLREACRRIGLEGPALLRNAEALVGAVSSLGIGNSAAVIRVQVSARATGRGFKRADSRTWALVEAFDVPPSRSVRMMLQPSEIDLPVPVLPRIKSCAALPHVLAAQAAAEAGVDELVRLHDGAITEAISSNIFWLSAGTLYTPADTLPLYPGVTRETVIEAATALGVPVETGTYGAAHLLEAEAILLTNAVRCVESVTEMDGRAMASTDLARGLAEASLRLRMDEGADLAPGGEVT